MNIKLTFGCMRSGKSKRLIQDYNAIDSVFGSENIVVLKSSVDTRSTVITSRSLHQTLDCKLIDDTEEWKDVVWLKPKFIFVDEVQFLTADELNWLISTCRKLSISLLLYGLDKDYTGNTFATFRLAHRASDKAEQLFATCDGCGNKLATYSKLLGKHSVGEDHILVGDLAYSPRCKDCI